MFMKRRGKYGLSGYDGKSQILKRNFLDNLCTIQKVNDTHL